MVLGGNQTEPASSENISYDALQMEQQLIVVSNYFYSRDDVLWKSPYHHQFLNFILFELKCIVHCCLFLFLFRFMSLDSVWQTMHFWLTDYRLHYQNASRMFAVQYYCFTVIIMNECLDVHHLSCCCRVSSLRERSSTSCSYSLHVPKSRGVHRVDERPRDRSRIIYSGHCTKGLIVQYRV